jgi:hypothetical protein
MFGSGFGDSPENLKRFFHPNGASIYIPLQRKVCFAVSFLILKSEVFFRSLWITSEHSAAARNARLHCL